jgi:hypothetical protein
MKFMKLKLGKMGDVPLPYIIALVLGIIVIVLIAYWLFVEGGLFGGTITEKGCEAKKLAYCSDWKVQGAAPAPGKFSKDCDTVNKDKSLYYAPECCIFKWASADLTGPDCGISTS